MNHSTRHINLYIGAMVLAAVATTASATLVSHTSHPYYALAVLILAALTSRMKVKLPGINGNMSVNMPFLLLAVINLSAAEAVAIACAATLVQTWPQGESKFKPEQMLFNVSMMAFATSMASLIWHSGWLGRSSWATQPLMLCSATAAFFFAQTAPVAGILRLTEGEHLDRIWLSIAQLSFPYFVVSAGLTSMVDTVSHHAGWRLALAVFPVTYCLYRSYQVYFANAAVVSVRLRARAAGAGLS